jgi:hypothetical protein
VIHLFDTDTAVAPISDGVWSAVLSDRWNALGGTPNGGYSLGIALRALAQPMAELGLLDPLVVSAFFLRRATPGPAEVRTELARVGKRTATGEARLLLGGVEAVRLVATFTDLGESRGRTLEFGRPPELPPPADCIDLMSGRTIPGVTVAERYDVRAPQLPGWAVGKPSGDPTQVFWMRFRDGREADTLSLVTMVDGFAPVTMELGERGSSTIELTVHIRARPAPGWLACRIQTRHVVAGYHEEDVEVWDSAGELVAQSRQIALLPATA